jgi:hypothetical protein
MRILKLIFLAAYGGVFYVLFMVFGVFLCTGFADGRISRLRDVFTSGWPVLSAVAAGMALVSLWAAYENSG